MDLGGIVDFVFPPRCGGCGARGRWLCPACVAGVRPAPRRRCCRCGRWCAVEPCPLCVGGAPALDSLTAMVVLEGPLRTAVHRLKYRDRPGLGAPLAAAALGACPNLPEGVAM